MAQKVVHVSYRPPNQYKNLQTPLFSLSPHRSIKIEKKKSLPLVSVDSASFYLPGNISSSSKGHIPTTLVAAASILPSQNYIQGTIQPIRQYDLSFSVVLMMSLVFFFGILFSFLLFCCLCRVFLSLKNWNLFSFFWPKPEAVVLSNAQVPGLQPGPSLNDNNQSSLVPDGNWNSDICTLDLSSLDLYNSHSNITPSVSTIGLSSNISICSIQTTSDKSCRNFQCTRSVTRDSFTT